MMTHFIKHSTVAATLVLGLFPTSVFAATTFRNYVEGTIIPLGDGVVTFLFTVAFLLFIVNMARYFFFSDEKGREKGKKYIFASILGFAVIASTWALVRILISSIGLPTS
jgi:RsiW-degrading membrane proteinase PrsW (M82 family)